VEVADDIRRHEADTRSVGKEGDAVPRGLIRGT